MRRLLSSLFACKIRSILPFGFQCSRMLSAAAADRNKECILQVLRTYVNGGKQYKALEVASGTGQHVTHFAQHLSNVSWIPTDVDKTYLKSIASHISATGMTGVSNVSPPRYLDCKKPYQEWIDGTAKVDSFDFVLNINMIHITPWECTLGLFQGAGIALKENGALITYGPYMVDGKITPESNQRFDVLLKQKCPDWGLRDTEVLKQLAEKNGLIFEAMHDMPANNKTVVFRKKPKKS